MYAPVPKPCQCGNSQHPDGYCDGTHLNEEKE